MNQKACHLQDDDDNNTQWDQMLAHFVKTKEICRSSFSREMPRVYKSKKTFPTGSSYEGMWNVLGMSGKGIYTYPNGVIYEGEFEDGVFHGQGELRYPSGIILRGMFINGTMVERKLIFAEGMQYEEKDWKYCTMPDRRYGVEFAKDLNPAGNSFMTAKQPSMDLPPDCYDYGETIYNSVEKTIMTPGSQTILGSPVPDVQEWIRKNCRFNRDETMGPRAYLYEEWSEPELNYLQMIPPPVNYTRPSNPKDRLKSESTKDLLDAE